MKLTNANIVRSVYDNQDDLLRGLMSLYCPSGFDLDVTYSKGNFYKNIPEPKFKMDLFPQTSDTIPADSTKLPVKSESVNTIMYDPPFIAGKPAKAPPGLMKKRFGYAKNIQHEMWTMYLKSLCNFYRALKPNGVLVVKNQDTIDSSKQYFSHVFIMNEAYKIGFYPRDLFILIAKSRMINQKSQQHARKYHCYFWVFVKEPSKVDYKI